MKKFWIIFTVIVSSCCLVSCNSDDDDEPIVKDKIIGKWQLSKEFLNDFEIPLDECELQMTIEFFDNGRYSEKDFLYDEIEEACFGMPVKSGTWENLGNSNYFLSDLGVESLKMTFVGDTMTVVYSETVEGVVLELKVIFIKVD